jgi:hypothetical protein
VDHRAVALFSLYADGTVPDGLNAGNGFRGKSAVHGPLSDLSTIHNGE